MAVPEDIRKVERPPNTIVQDSGRDGPKRYSVRARAGSRYVPGGNPQPINGKTIGYIIDHKYVPLCDESYADKPSMLSYGTSALVKSVSDDVMSDLLSVFPPNDAFSILSIAALKIAKPKISGKRMASAYEQSFVSLYWPGAALSSNSISALYKKLGADGKKRETFFEKRVSRVCKEHHILIDGTLKQNTSIVNDLSAFSYKARLKGCEDVSVLYAFDLEKMEPVCAQVFPGNSIDAVSYRSFIRDNKIRHGIIISDKGFPPNEIRDILASQPWLHYLTPVKRNDSRIDKLSMTQYEGVLTGIDKTVQYKKANAAPGIWLYSFRDLAQAAAEEKSFLEKARKNGTYDDASFRKKKPAFGLIVFESDKDLDPKAAYLSYSERWKLELVFKAYKSDECLDCTHVQGDFSVYGAEFVNFISTLLTCRIITKATKAKLFDEMTYSDMLDDLNSAWRHTDVSLDDKPMSGDEHWVHTIPKVFDILERMDLSIPVKKEPQRSGLRPKKNKSKLEQKDKGKSSEPNSSNPKSDRCIENKNHGENGTVEKRSVGRPRTRPVPNPDSPRRPVGRPRTRPIPDPSVPKRPVGRPRTRPLPDPNAIKRPVGRPRKQSVEEGTTSTET